VKKSKEQSRYAFNYQGIKAGNEDKQMRSDWYFPICAGKERETFNGAKAHTTQKPEALLHRILASTSHPGDVVLDPFCGTGTTAAVAKRLGRNFITIDREEAYVCIARERIAAVQTLPFSKEGAPAEAPKPRVSFLSLVEAGIIRPGEELRLCKTNIAAIVQADGTLVANGYRGSIHKVGAQCLALPSCNGWTHWQYRDPQIGEWRLLDELRQQGE
jgi:modification methylase